MLAGGFRRFDWKHAIGEVILIVVGVLTALAVDAWWDRRKDEATERAYLQQLLRDVEANESALDAVIAAHTNGINGATRLASAFDAPGALPSCDALAEMLETALMWAPLQLRTGTYSALLATGDIRLIRDDGLRSEVIQYAGLVDVVTAALIRNESDAWASAYTFRRRVPYFWRLFQPRRPSDPPPSAGCHFEPLRHDADVREALFSIHLLHENRNGSVKELAAANKTLRSRLAAEIADND
jgi:hypothetical protein